MHMTQQADTPRLSAFIRGNLDLIMKDFEEFARRCLPHTEKLTKKEIHNHVTKILLKVADDMEEREDGVIERNRPRIDTDCHPQNKDAHIHGEMRVGQGFNILGVNAEYCWLRAAILRHWFSHEGTGGFGEEVIHFNAALDQALTASLASFHETIEDARSTFLGILGHDIRNSLSAIHGMAQVLTLSNHLHKRDREMARKIQSSVLNIEAITNNLLELTRLEMGAELSVTPEPAEIEEVCRAAVEETLHAYLSAEIQLNITGCPVCNVDALRLRQVVTNLLRNALDHGDRGQPVSIDIRQESENVVIAVHNHGDPIPSDRFNRIFERFSLTGDINEARHLGLGLYIVSRIVEAHKGKIEVVSSEKEGTCFRVILPCNAPADEPI